MRKIAVILMSYDGIVNNYCGVGTSVRSFIHAFPKIRNFLLKQNIDLNLHLISPALVENSLGYNQKIKNESEIISKESNGSLNLIINGSNGMIPYGQIENWKTASIAAANTSLNIASNYNESLLFCFDTPFAHVPHYVGLQKSAFGIKDIKSICVFESDVYIHEPENPSFDRMGWEASALKLSEYDDSVFIANTGEFIINHLLKNYGLNKSKIVNLVQGLDPDSPKFQTKNDQEVKIFLNKYGIPLNKKLIFSVGRAVEYKGFDLLIKACSKIKEKAHLVFIASPYKTEANFVSELQNLIKKSNIECTAIFNCDFELPQYICQWRNTKIVAQLSKCEPFGLVPEEVRLWTKIKKGPVVLASNKDGFVEQIDDGIDGFLVNINNIDEIASKIDYILKLKESKLAEIRKNGKKKFADKFDYRVNEFKCLTEIINIYDEKILNKFKKEILK